MSSITPNHDSSSGWKKRMLLSGCSPLLIILAATEATAEPQRPVSGASRNHSEVAMTCSLGDKSSTSDSCENAIENDWSVLERLSKPRNPAKLGDYERARKSIQKEMYKFEAIRDYLIKRPNDVRRSTGDNSHSEIAQSMMPTANVHTSSPAYFGVEASEGLNFSCFNDEEIFETHGVLTVPTMAVPYTAITPQTPHGACDPRTPEPQAARRDSS